MKKLTYMGLTYGLLEGNRALSVPATPVKPGIEVEPVSPAHEKWLLEAGFEAAGEAPVEKFEGVVAQPFVARGKSSTGDKPDKEVK